MNFLVEKTFKKHGESSSQHGSPSDNAQVLEPTVEWLDCLSVVMMTPL